MIRTVRAFPRLHSAAALLAGAATPLLAGAAAALLAGAAAAQDPPQGQEPTLQELGRRIDLIAEELQDLKIGPAAAPRADQSQYGFGPAASKIYRTEHGVSIGGYGEMVYQNFDSRNDAGAPSGATDQIDFLRAVLYFGYKFDERWLFNSEIEIEHASTGQGGEVSVEFAYLDYRILDEINARAGLLLVPMGFLNELHEPTTFLSANRPGIERMILPTTWRENGAGVFGQVGDFSYRAYVLAGLEAAGFRAGGIRGARQQGARSVAEDFAAVGRVDWTGLPGLLAGASAYSGNSGQGLMTPSGAGVDAATTIFEGHLQWNWRGLQARALAVTADIDEAARINRALGLTGNASVGEALRGYYLELAYDVLSLTGSDMALLFFARWETFDTQAEVPTGFAANPANDVDILTVGLAFQPFPQGILKLDVQNLDNGAGTAVDQINFALGYIF